MDVAPWDKHWIKRELDCFGLYSMVLLHSPDYLPQNLRTQKFGLLERNKQDFLTFSWFILIPDLWKCFTLGSLGNGTIGGFIGQTYTVYFQGHYRK